MARKHTSIAAIIGAVSVLGLGGVAIAASGGANDRATSVAEALTEQTGTQITSQDVIAAQTQVATDRIEQALADGKITQEQADSALERIADGDFGRGGFGGGPGHGGGPATAVAEALGLDQDALREALQGGQTLAEYAESRGKTRAEVIGAITQSMTERAEERGVELPDEETLTSRAESIADGERGAGGHRGFGGPPPAEPTG